LFKVGGIYDKDGGTMLARFGKSASVSKNINDGVHVFFLRTDEQCGVTPPQESTGAGDTGYPVTVGYQLFDHGPGVYVLDDGND
jgi:hypothetical protein